MSSRIAKKYIKFGINPDEVNAQDLPANYTPTNYTPVEVSSEGTNKTSAHLKGINDALGASDLVTGDIPQTTWTGLLNNSADQAITGLTFANATVRSFTAQVAFNVAATTDVFAQYTINGIQRSGDWQITTDLVGDSLTDISFSITTSGQVRVTIGSIAGFTGATVKFRAKVTSV